MTDPTTDKPTAEDVAMSLTGYDEIAITQTFGTDCSVLMSQDSMTTARALAFILERRTNGGDDKAAKKTVMNMPYGEVRDRFAEPTEDDGRESVDTPSGEDDSQPD